VRIILLFSGGVDSVWLANMALMWGYRIDLLHIEYEHPSSLREAIAARKWFEDHESDRLTLTRIKVPILAPNLSTGHGMPGPRVVPGRNAIFVALAVNRAAQTGATEVWLGCTAEDSAYPDCSLEWIEGQDKEARKWGVRIVAPAIRFNRAHIMRQAMINGHDLDSAWSCYEPGEKGEPCGVCDSCLQGQV
jgi:7-cyano-7-deazaguanine synthase in queuosine biosynthesis